MDVLFDNVIFELQRTGGISLLWAKLTEYCGRCADVDPAYVEGPSAAKNVFRREYAASLSPILADRRLPIGLRRFLPVNQGFGQIFHSSYHRVSMNRRHRQVVTVHDLIYEKLSAGLTKVVQTQQRRASLRCADAIICVSEHTRRDLLECYSFVDPAIVRVVPNGVDERFVILSNCEPVLKAKGHDLRRRSFLLYVGLRGRYKNFVVALDVVQSREARELGLRLVTVGGGPPTDTERRVVAERRLDERVVFLGDVSSGVLNSLYNMAFALIYPSKYEGFGIPPLEAMRAGCPVLASNATSIPEIVGAAAVLCDPCEPRQFCDGLRQFVDNADRQRYVKEGLTRSAAFSWAQTCEQTVRVYRSL